MSNAFFGRPSAPGTPSKTWLSRAKTKVARALSGPAERSSANRMPQSSANKGGLVARAKAERASAQPCDCKICLRSPLQTPPQAPQRVGSLQEPTKPVSQALAERPAIQPSAASRAYAAAALRGIKVGSSSNTTRPQPQRTQSSTLIAAASIACASATVAGAIHAALQGEGAPAALAGAAALVATGLLALEHRAAQDAYAKDGLRARR